MWWQLAFGLASMFIAYILWPRPNVENARASNFSDINFPRATEGAPVSLVFGLVRVQSPNTLWIGDYSYSEITEKVKTGFFSSETVTKGYKYYVGLAMSICLGPDIKLHRIWIGNKEVWSGEVSSAGDIVEIDKPELFGNDAGGWIGEVYFYPGSFTQPVNDYLKGFDADSPAYVGQSYVVFKKNYIGNSANLREMSFEVSCYSNYLGLGNKSIIGVDSNPAEILYKMLISGWGCLEVPTSEIDVDSFKKSGETLFDEGNGMSLLLSNNNESRSVIKEIIRQTNGLIYQDSNSGKIVYKLIRQDYNADDLPLFDSNNIKEINSYNVGTWEETANQVRVTFEDRADKYKSSATTAQDSANIAMQGKLKTVTVSYPGIKTSGLATRTAAVELSYLSVPTTRIIFEANYSGSLLNPGDPIKVKYITDSIEIFRVQKLQITPESVMIEAIKDVFASDIAVISAPGVSRAVTLSKPAHVPLETVLIEAPYFFTRTSDIKLMGFGSPADENQISYSINTVQGASSDYSGKQRWTSIGLLQNIGTSITVKPDPYSRVKLDNVYASDIRLGANLIMISNIRNSYSSRYISFLDGDEILGYEKYRDNGDGTITFTNLHRGLLDTSKKNFDVNSPVWSMTNRYFGSYVGPAPNDRFGAVIKSEFTSYSMKDSDTTLSDRIRGIVYPVNRSLLPYPPVNLTIVGEDTDNLQFRNNQVIRLQWSHRDRDSTKIVLPGDKGDALPDNVTYTVKIFVLEQGQLSEIVGLSVDNISGDSTQLQLKTAGKSGILYVAVYSNLDGVGYSYEPCWVSGNIV